MMENLLLDNPLVLSVLFHPRTEKAHYLDAPGKVKDGTIPVDEHVVLGYRLYIHEPDKPVIVYFHGNGEVASDHDSIASLYHQAGASLLVVDYRGYGWSTGKPLTSKLFSDMEGVFGALPAILENAQLANSPVYVMGRSLGSICAIHSASLYPEYFKGLIIESGIGATAPLLARLGLPLSLFANFPDPIRNVEKVSRLSMPLLVIHGERDSLLPVNNGQALYDASPSKQKTIFRVPGAEHNNILYVGIPRYFDEIRQFIGQASG